MGALRGAAAPAILTVDYFEREPWWLIAVAAVWGGLIATGLALSANEAVQSLLTTTAGQDVAQAVGGRDRRADGRGDPQGARRRHLRAARHPPDALARRRFILGAVVGLGFQVVEDVVYTANVMAVGQDPRSALVQMFVLRGIMGGLWSHAVYTGLFGLGLGYALTRVQWSLAMRALAAVAGFVAAWSLHFLWNSPLLVDTTDWRLVVVKGLPALLLLLALLHRAQRADSAVFLPALAAVGNPMIATDGEIAALTDRRSRAHARSEATRPEAAAGRRAFRHLQRGQADMAVALATGDQSGASRASEEIAQARRQLGQLPQHPPVVGRGSGTWSAVLGLAGLFVPIVGVAAVVVAVVGLVRARSRDGNPPGGAPVPAALAGPRPRRPRRRALRGGPYPLLTSVTMRECPS